MRVKKMVSETTDIIRHVYLLIEDVPGIVPRISC